MRCPIAIRFVLISVIALSVPSLTAAQQWQPTGGPLGGEVNALLVRDGIAFAGTRSGGIFRSDDLGISWSRLEATDPLEAVTGFARDSEDRLFASTNQGIRRSTDGGNTWELLNNGLPGSRSASSVVVNDADIVLLGTRFSGVYRSADNGGSWIESNNGLTNTRVTALALAADGTVYAGTDNGVFMSSDGADSWTDISEGFSSPSIRDLLVADDGALWAAAFGVYRLEGSTWDRKLSESTWSLGGTSSGALVAGVSNRVRITDDQGDTWSDYSVDDGVFLSVVAMAGAGSTILAGTASDGVYRSTDDGQTWEPARDGFDAVSINALAANQSGALIAATGNGAFRSDNSGGSWQRANTDLPIVNVEGIEVLSTGVVLAGSNNDGIYLSTDFGESWSKPDPSQVQIGFRSFAEAPTGEIFAGSRDGKIYRSQSEVISWDSVDVNTDGSSVEALLATSDGSVLAGSNLAVRRSTDGGDTWEDVSNGLPENPDVFDLLETMDGSVLLACYWGVYQWSESGGEWTKTGDVPGLGVRAITQDSEGTLYIGMRGFGAAYSIDGGVSWTRINSGLNNLDITSLISIPAVGKRDGLAANDAVYAGTRGGGVSRLVSVATSLTRDNPVQPGAVRLAGNYPNPFQASTAIPIELTRASIVDIVVFDVLGREVKRMDRQHLSAGRNELQLQGVGLAPGVYFYRVDGEGLRATGSMLKE